jgi:DNA uptake protein ComE-like DNA-binding protein
MHSISKEYSTLTLTLLLLTLSGQLLLRSYEGYNQKESLAFEKGVSSQLRKIFNDSESRIAAGVKLDLCTITLYDLTLVSGISDRLAKNIIKERNDSYEEICQSIDVYDNSEREKILEAFLIKIHGIGYKRLEHLKKYMLIKE